MTWVDFVVRATVLLSVALAAAYAMQRASAALRHFLWTASFAALLLLPIAVKVRPRLALLPANRVVTAAVTATVHATPAHVRLPGTPAVPKPSTNVYWLALYLVGASIVAARFVGSAWRMRSMVRLAKPAPYAHHAASAIREELAIARTVRVLESEQAHVPMAWGVARAVVLLPPDARQWPADRVRAVLLHEMVHVARYDVLSQVVAQAACCLYWWHPLAWFAARQLRKERERACDDAVLQRGIDAPDYAGHLMELVRALVERRASLADAPAMAEAGDLEERVRALLDRTRNRRPLTRRAAAAVAMLACAAVLSVASHAQQPRGALAGIVQDPSGARVPRSEITIRNLDGSNEEVAVVNAAGEYAFPSIPAGRYAIEARAPGFKIGKAEIVVVAGAAARADVPLEIGGLSETVKIKGTRSTPAPAATLPMGTPQRIPIGGNVQASKLLFRKDPEYPPDLKQQGVTGTVIIRAIISKTGDILNARVINTVHPGLAQAALDAVKQWRHEPTLLNGHPVEVITTITMSFELDQ